jgi:beta-glucosidase
VLVVAGRPLILTDQLGEIDALVASWLPGSQGEGVADVLFGNRPFTGRLPQTWPRTLEQEPINIGDRDYHPLYPYGWGLRTHAGH